MLKEMLNHVREKCPLIHNITNYVTVNDCANILLACGGSPIMADDAEEAEEITAICGGLNINIGTLNQRTIPAMHLAGKKANELGHPVVLDLLGQVHPNCGRIPPRHCWRVSILRFCVGISPKSRHWLWGQAAQRA